ncbi:MAG: hypothetical protein NXI10_14800 [bacterium]|nr:hypothetical protein [bacterium]
MDQKKDKAFQMSEKTYMNTLSQGIKQLAEQGFTNNFEVTENGFLKMEDSDVKIAPEETVIVEVKRYEGSSNPSDMSVLYGVVTESGEKGILIDSFGSKNSENITTFLQKTDRAV